MLRRPPRSTPFPTRRSSDLVEAAEVAGVDEVGAVGAGGPVGAVVLDELAVCGDQDGLDRVAGAEGRSEEHTSELQSHVNLVCRLLLEKKKRGTAELRLLRGG